LLASWSFAEVLGALAFIVSAIGVCHISVFRGCGRRFVHNAYICLVFDVGLTKKVVDGYEYAEWLVFDGVG
jgi:hypothetical protein